VRRVRDAKAAAVRSFVRSVRGLVTGYVSMHMDFVTQRHGEALRYVAYWSAMPADLFNSKVVEMMKRHEEDRARVVEAIDKLLTVKLPSDVRAAASEVLSARSGALEMSDSQVHDATVELQRLRDWLGRQGEELNDLYMRGGAPLLRSLLDPKILTLYALKALHVLIAWYAVNIASSVCQSAYRRAVYTLDNPPPSPLWFVLLALLLDAGMHVAVGVLLLVAKNMFKADDNTFPVDATLLRMWAFDCAVVGAAVAALSVLVAEVVHSKKYFRYKYEGERGLRALRDMTFYTYCVLAPVPFYRLVLG
jgi:hypothetical protein